MLINKNFYDENINGTNSKSIRGVLYLCQFDHDKLEIKVIRELLFEKPWDTLLAFVEIPNPESQMACGTSYNKMCSDLLKLHDNMNDKEWLKELSNCL